MPPKHLTSLFNPSDITNAFATALHQALKNPRTLYIHTSEFSLFSQATLPSAKSVRLVDEIRSNDLFDYIVGDLPIGMHVVSYPGTLHGQEARFQQNWIWLLSACKALKPDGYALINVELYALCTPCGKAFERLLEENGFFIQAIINTPADICKPYTSIRPVLLLISRKPIIKYFIAELSSISQAQELARRCLTLVDSDNLENGILTDKNAFVPFERFKILKQIDMLEKQVKGYARYPFSIFALSIRTVPQNGSFDEKPNAIYFPKLRYSKVVASLDQATMKHQNYFQVLLNPEILSNNYLAIFFGSALGQLIMDSLDSRGVIAHINKSSLEQVEIPAPPLSEQLFLVETYEKLNRLKSSIGNFEQELALNPASAHTVQPHLEQVLNSLGILTNADRVLSLIREGESKRTEFKQTLSLDLKTLKREPYIELGILKTIAAFLNTEGGTLLIGIADDGSVWGINQEAAILKKTNDKMLLHLKDLLQSRIGEDCYPFIDYRIVDLSAAQILLVDCKQAKIPCYLDQKDFYIRINPATDKLEGPKLVQYIKQHFRE